MGDPPKLRNKYERPKRMWDKDRLEEEKALKKDYGLKCMRELWVISAELKKYRREARRLLSQTEEERKADSDKILSKLAKIGILKHGAVIEDILGLSIRDLLERRLQTIVVRKGLARTMSQSRQLITHGFISLDGRRVQTPSYLVKKDVEATLSHSRPIEISVKEAQPAPEAGAAKPQAQVL